MSAFGWGEGRPKSKERLLQLKKQFPQAKLVVGNSEVGIEMKFKHAEYPVLVGTTHISELNSIQVALRSPLLP